MRPLVFEWLRQEAINHLLCTRVVSFPGSPGLKHECRRPGGESIISHMSLTSLIYEKIPGSLRVPCSRFGAKEPGNEVSKRECSTSFIARSSYPFFFPSQTNPIVSHTFKIVP